MNVSAARSPIGRAYKGSLADMRPDDLTVQMVRAALDQVPQLDPADIDDIMLGKAELDYDRLLMQPGPTPMPLSELPPDIQVLFARPVVAIKRIFMISPISYLKGVPSGDGHQYRVPAGSPAGKDLGAPRRLGHARFVGGADLERV